ncbi:MAG: AAA family ATPase [Desulfovibrionaceae bacterium]|nr:AAA family ATPase [Desulfovibrionaceae bacterium]
MGFKIGVGKSDFAKLRESDNYYVDKTELLYELVHETDNEVTLFTRPRRFGKTLMMSMIENFFNIRKNSKDIFNGLAITKHEDFCQKWMNQYPVLLISLKDAESTTYEVAYEKLNTIIADLCKSISDISNNNLIDKDDLEIYAKLKAQRGTESDIQNSLKVLMRMLYRVYDKKIILLIDEYDVPIAKSNENDNKINQYYSKMFDIIKGILSTSLKDNEFLQFAVLTGCLRIAKESIFTYINNFVSYSVLDANFSNYFGFSFDEVHAMLEAFDRTDKIDIIKEWYDGYIFGNSSIYCPWDLINYISDLRQRNNAKPKNYWKHTSHNSILLSFVKRRDFNVKGKFEILMNNGSIVQKITDKLTYNNLHSSEDNLWSVLLMTGYLTKVDANVDEDMVRLKIPNKEVKSIFEETVVTLFKETIDITIQKRMIQAFWDQDTSDATTTLSELLFRTISYNDYHEDYYHAFLAGAFVGIGYAVESNKEKGLGRPDILIKDENNRRAIIIEAKKSKKDSDLENDCNEALHQIITKKYADELYGYKHILCYGVAFFQKQALVKCL